MAPGGHTSQHQAFCLAGLASSPLSLLPEGGGKGVMRGSAVGCLGRLPAHSLLQLPSHKGRQQLQQGCRPQAGCSIDMQREEGLLLTKDAR